MLEEKLEIRKIILSVIETEGGLKLVNDPDDPGGLTFAGITLKTFAPWYNQLIYDGKKLEATDIPYGAVGEDGPVDFVLRNLSLDDVVFFYYDYFWSDYLEQIPIEFAHQIFDCMVNLGKGGTVRIVQKLLNDWHAEKNDFSYHLLKLDGVLGPITKQEIDNFISYAMQFNPGQQERIFNHWNNKLAEMRIERYIRLCGKNPKLIKYLWGWYQRAVAFRMGYL